jgi:hypothetical protein
MMDHASLFTKIVHPYLPKLYILIYRKCTFLFTESVHYYLPIIVHCYLPITIFLAASLLLFYKLDFPHYGRIDSE